MLLLDFPTRSTEEPAPWEKLPTKTRLRLYGTYYAWWLAEIIAVKRQPVLRFMLDTYVHSKFSAVVIPRNLLGTVYFEASLEGRMNSSLKRYFSDQQVFSARGQSLAECVKAHAPGNPSWENSLEAINDLCAVYENAYHEAAPYRIEFCELPHEADPLHPRYERL